MDFTPLIVAYLTDASDPDQMARGHSAGVFTTAKLYPAHATTGSAHGVTDIARIMPVLERMAIEGDSFGRMLGEPAAREAFTAFMQKRKPDFSQC